MHHATTEASHCTLACLLWIMSETKHGRVLHTGLLFPLGRLLLVPDGTPVDHSVAAVHVHLVYVLQTEIDRLKRQIAEKEAAVKAGQASLPAVIKVSASSHMFFCAVDGSFCAPTMQLQVCNHSASVQVSISLR